MLSALFQHPIQGIMLINSGIIIYCLECLLWVPGSREKQRKSNTSAILMVFMLRLWEVKWRLVLVIITGTADCRPVPPPQCQGGTGTGFCGKISCWSQIERAEVWKRGYRV